MKKIYVEAKVRLIIRQDDGVNTEDVLDNMDYDFISNNDGADIEDTEIIDWKIQDSK